MKIIRKQFVGIKTCSNRGNAFSLVEMLVVISIVALLIGVSIPAINSMQKSYDSTGAKGMIEAALSTARSLAISNQRHVGIRFQKAANATAANVEDDPLNRDQYMIFIIHEEKKKSDNDKDVFHTIEGRKPIKLPSNTGVMDFTNIGSNSDIDDDSKVIDATTFSIVFSPAGKLIQRDAQTRNTDGDSSGSDKDDVINTEDKIKAGLGMFLQDEFEERSRMSFVIYSRENFAEVFAAGNAYDGYLADLDVCRINSYTGAIIGN